MEMYITKHILLYFHMNLETIFKLYTVWSICIFFSLFYYQEHKHDNPDYCTRFAGTYSTKRITAKYFTL